MHTACIVCHHAIEMGRLKVSGKAPDEITWEGPFGVIERPRPKPKEQTTEMSYTHADASDIPNVKESRESYGVPALALDPHGSNVVPRGSESTNDRGRMRRARASAVVSLSSLVPRGSIGEIRPMRPTI